MHLNASVARAKSKNIPVLGLFYGEFSSYSNNAITLASRAQGMYQSPKYGKFMEPPEILLCAIAFVATKLNPLSLRLGVLHPDITSL